MAEQIDYQILLQEVVRTARKAAASAAAKPGAEDLALLYAYHDILDVVKTLAEAMEVPLADLGLDGVDLDALLKAQIRKAA